MRTVTVRVRPDGTWSGRLPALARGEHLVAVRHVDREGHASPLSDAVDLLVVGAPTIVGGPSIVTSASSPELAVLSPEGGEVETEVIPAAPTIVGGPSIVTSTAAPLVLITTTEGTSVETVLEEVA